MAIKFPRPIDWVLYGAPLALLVFGIAVISSLSVNLRTQLVTNQLVFAVIGVTLTIILTLLDYRTFKTIGYFMYVLGIGALALVLVFGSKAFGATRWIDVGLFQFQPSELFKPLLVMTLAKLFAEHPSSVRTGVIAGLLTVVPVALVIKQPDLGTAATLVFVAGAIAALKRLPWRLWLIGGVAIFIAIPILFASLKPYQRQRIQAFANPAADPLGSGYNIKQSLIAVGSGGIYGRGLGQGSQSQLQFLPVAHTDFIFAGAAEATGFLGSILMLGLIVLLVLRIINVARVSQDDFGYYFAFGIACLYFFQSAINIGVNVGLLPATGVPLPFVSHGGTQTITSLATIGILQSIYLRHKKIRFE